MEILLGAEVPPFPSGPKESHSAGWKARVPASAGLQCELLTTSLMPARCADAGESPFILALGNKWSVIGQFTNFFILHRCVSS